MNIEQILTKWTKLNPFFFNLGKKYLSFLPFNCNYCSTEKNQENISCIKKKNKGRIVGQNKAVFFVMGLSVYLLHS